MIIDHFIPPIKSRTDDELLQIVGAPEKWTPDAVSLAHEELSDRKIPVVKIEMARYLEDKRDQLTLKLKSNESYHLCDFLLSPSLTFIELLFSWELNKDGYHRKARQQKRFRVFIIIFVFFLFLLFQIAQIFKD
ncbi:hypothetical protein LX97_02824 [Nonlabens dokdonensis]|jgi:hypothetical protein|uniref:Uncharacterized protein n=2 Tax=Nonlabens dokdonensis TaxID=328515 RepID=L7WEX6_NONDD|nr:hypothetical protein [Nonlabens dokdonensis]AGC78501.1 hypothetical protein DDD_3374 [Nonlabens dokdonensis DSW-6]PZX38243.1 hypothetical protein LX97_02824 [Nonlabens dokdonensis]